MTECVACGAPARVRGCGGRSWSDPRGFKGAGSEGEGEDRPPGGAAGGGGNNSGGVTVANQSIPQGPQRQSPVAGMSQEEIRERTPEDIPILVDDDIIARQLREAALTEDDPVLRERLWEEYRKYSGI